MKEKQKEKDGELSFEKKLQRLEKIVDTLEAGNVPLEDSLKMFEEGVGLIRSCQSILNTAEQKIQKLVGEKNGEPVLEPFDVEEE